MNGNGALQVLAERARITDAINRLSVATDRRDWPSVRDCFAGEVLFDMSSLGAGAAVRMSPDAIASAWESGLEPIESVHHQSGNFCVEVSASEAKVSCYGIAYHFRRTASGRNTRVFVGSYDFHLVHEADWKIDEFRFNLKFIDGNASLEQDPLA